MLKMITEKVINNNVIDALANFGMIDEDFNGNNGNECLWECACGYSSNLEYTLDVIKYLRPYPYIAIDTFFDMWLYHVAKYEYDIICDDNDNITHIVLAYIMED